MAGTATSQANESQQVQNIFTPCNVTNYLETVDSGNGVSSRRGMHLSMVSQSIDSTLQNIHLSSSYDGLHQYEGDE